MEKNDEETREYARLSPGDLAPDFSLTAEGGGTVRLSDVLSEGRRVVLYFYPAALTPGCTTEACDFRDSFNRLSAAGYTVIGVSRDSVNKLTNFRNRHHLNFALLSDTDLTVHKMYGAYGVRKLYGREHVGVIRSTIVIDTDEHVLLTRYNVRAKGHVDSLLKQLAKLGPSDAAVLAEPASDDGHHGHFWRNIRHGA